MEMQVRFRISEDRKIHPRATSSNADCPNRTLLVANEGMQKTRLQIFPFLVMLAQYEKAPSWKAIIIVEP